MKIDKQLAEAVTALASEHDKVLSEPEIMRFARKLRWTKRAVSDYSELHKLVPKLKYFLERNAPLLHNYIGKELRRVFTIAQALQSRAPTSKSGRRAAYDLQQITLRTATVFEVITGTPASGKRFAKFLYDVHVALGKYEGEPALRGQIKWLSVSRRKQPPANR